MDRTAKELSLIKDGIGDKGLTYTMEDALNTLGFGRFQVMLLIIVGLFSFAELVEAVLVAVIPPAIGCYWNLNPYEMALIPSISSIGMMVGFVWGYLSDRYGRWPILFVGCTAMGYYGFLSAFAPSYIWLLIFRFLVGVFVSTFWLSYGFLAEFYPPKHRGKCLVMHSFLGSIGVTVQYAMASKIIPNLGWRWHTFFSVLPLLLVLLLFLFIPESPRYYLVKGNVSKALEVLEKIARMNKVDLPVGKLLPVKEVKHVPVLNLLSRKFRRTTIIIWINNFFMSLCAAGGFFLSAEASIITAQTCSVDASLGRGFESSCMCHPMTADDYNTALIGGIGQIPAAVLNLVFLDILGRKWSLAIYQFLSGIFIFLLLLCSTPAVLKTFIFLMRVFIYAAMGASSILRAEIYPTEYRSVSIGINGTLGAIGFFITPFISNVLVLKSVVATMCIFGGFLIFNAVLILFIKHETKGKPMDIGH